MSTDEVLAVLDRLAEAGVEPWVEGGWGVDALVGAETRLHEDLDLVLSRRQWDSAVEALRAFGLEVDDDRSQPPASLVLREDTVVVDLHPVVLDDRGNGWQPHGPRVWALYPAEGFEGRGTIAGRVVRCISPEVQVGHHLGYEWDENDLRDMHVLAERFGLALPPSKYEEAS
jgi:lincosamide nucleotidyltransferase A/C/D/E